VNTRFKNPPTLLTIKDWSTLDGTLTTAADWCAAFAPVVAVALRRTTAHKALTERESIAAEELARHALDWPTYAAAHALDPNSLRAFWAVLRVRIERRLTDEYRRLVHRSGRPERPQEQPLDDEQQAEPLGHDSDLLDALRRGWDLLPSGHRLVLALRVLQGQPSHEVRRTLGRETSRAHAEAAAFLATYARAAWTEQPLPQRPAPIEDLEHRARARFPRLDRILESAFRLASGDVRTLEAMVSVRSHQEAAA